MSARNGAPEGPPEEPPESRSRARLPLAFRWKWAVALQLLMAIPYLLAVWMTPPGFRFGGFIYNPDDPYVYLSWMRQAFEGHFLFHNLFTLERQSGASFHILFLGLGLIARAAGLSLVLVYQLARGFLGIGLVAMLGGVIARLEPAEDRRSRVLLVATLGSGLGWTAFLAGSPLLNKSDLYHVPTDAWMTETIPFLSVLLNPLFAAALLLLLGSFFCMLTAENKESFGWAAAGGGCLLVLGNIHSYDILVFHPVWIVFLLLMTTISGRTQAAWPGWRPVPAWLRYLAAAAIGSPSVLYQAWVFRHDAAFHARALVPTLSPSPLYYLLGVGLLLPLACLSAWKRHQSPWVWWLCVWGVTGLVLPYVPMAFQRKLAIGLDVPYLLLAGMEVASWSNRAAQRRPDLGRLISLLLIALLFTTNACFLASDIRLLARNQSNVFPPLYIPDSDWKGVTWLAAHRGTRDAVLALPALGNIIPSATGQSVYVGHWGETTGFDEKWRQARDFYQGVLPPNTAAKFLADNRLDFVFEGSAETIVAQSGGDSDLSHEVAGLTRVYSNGPNLTIYRFNLPAGLGAKTATPG